MNVSRIFFQFWYARVCLLGLSVAIFVCLTWFFGWKPLFSGVSRQYTQITANQKKETVQRYRYYQYVSRHTERRRDLDSVYQRLMKMTSHPSSIEMTKFLEEVADNSGVKKSDIRWLERRQTPWYEEKGFELKVAGNFVALERFFKKLAEHEPLVVFSYSQWQKSDVPGDINVMAKGYTYRWTGEGRE